MIFFSFLLVPVVTNFLYYSFNVGSLRASGISSHTPWVHMLNTSNFQRSLAAQ